MNQEIRKLAISQYIKSFLWLFIILGILCVGALITLVKNMMADPNTVLVRNNSVSPKERVFDYADIFSPEEEQALRNEIGEIEGEIGCDIIIVSISQMVEGAEAAQTYGYRYNDWDYNMRDLADDFYDNNNYGFNAPHGDGVLFLTNDLQGQKGTWLSTSGKAEMKMSSEDIDQVLTQIDNYLIPDPDDNYRAHLAGIRAFQKKMNRNEKQEMGETIYLVAFIAPIVIGIVFFLANFKSKEGSVTVTASTYLDKKGANMYNQKDIFINKEVTKRHIDTSSSGGGGGGGGHHTSSGGHSHGGGGHRR